MALIIIERLLPEPPKIGSGEDVALSVKIRDDEAGETPNSHVFVLRLAEGNDLSFASEAGGASPVKEKSFTRNVGATAKVQKFQATIHGKGEGLGAFRVLLDVPGTPGIGWTVRLK